MDAGSSPVQYTDLRDFLRQIDTFGELVKIDGVDWDIEMGGVIEMVARAEPRNPSAVLFDNIKGYPRGFRVTSGATNSPRRLALLLGLPTPSHPLDVVIAYRERLRKDFRLIPPKIVERGPVFENVQRDDQVNIFKFPVPKLHARDGGRYIGTDDLVIMRDPDTGWVNAATYRVQAHDHNTAGLNITPGHQGLTILQKYAAKGQPCPVVVCCGHDPLLFLAASSAIAYGTSEFDYAGGQKGRPYEVVESELHRLPIPADAEIALEGEIPLDASRPEGPFGEFTGYYASGTRDEPTIHVRRVYHRDDPILTVACPMRPPSDFMAATSMMYSGSLWNEMEQAGMTGIKGVWIHWATRMFCVISIKQAYPGHAQQAAMLASSCKSGVFFGRYTVVVDDDIDPSDMDAVLWALGTRTDPATDIDIVRQTWSTKVDPMYVAPSQSSRALINACRPWEKLGSFAPVAEGSPEFRQQIIKKWGGLLNGGRQALRR